MNLKNLLKSSPSQEEKKDLFFKEWNIDSSKIPSAIQFYEQYQLAAFLVQRPIEDMLKYGIRLDEASETFFHTYHLAATLEKALKLSRLYGAVLVVAFTYDLNTDFSSPLKAPFKLSHFECIPHFQVKHNQRNETWYEISEKKRIHPSRAFILYHEENLSYHSTQTPYLGVLDRWSVRLSLWQYEEFQKTLDFLLKTDGLNIYKMNGLNQALRGNPLLLEDVQKRIKNINQGRNRGKLVGMDKDDEYETVNLSLGYLEAMRDSLMIKLSSEFRIPMLILFGLLPSGLNQSGGASSEDYFTLLESIFYRKLKPLLTFMLSFQSDFSIHELSIQMGYSFRKTDLNKADFFLKIAQSDEINIKNGVYSKEQAAKKYQQYNFLDFLR